MYASIAIELHISVVTEQCIMFSVTIVIISFLSLKATFGIKQVRKNFSFGTVNRGHKLPTILERTQRSYMATVVYFLTGCIWQSCINNGFQELMMQLYLFWAVSIELFRLLNCFIKGCLLQRCSSGLKSFPCTSALDLLPMLDFFCYVFVQASLNSLSCSFLRWVNKVLVEYVFGIFPRTYILPHLHLALV